MPKPGIERPNEIYDRVIFLAGACVEGCPDQLVHTLILLVAGTVAFRVDWISIGEFHAPILR